MVGGTMTKEGFIPHKKYLGILLPVKLDIHNYSVGQVMKYQNPVRGDGELVYALPGGW